MIPLLFCLLQATPVTPGTPVHGEVPDEGVVEYPFAAVQDGEYTIAVRLDTLPDSLLTLVGSDHATQIAANDDAQGDLGLGSQIEWTCPQAGTYFLRVEGYLYYTGTFTLTIEEVRPIPPEAEPGPGPEPGPEPGPTPAPGPGPGPTPAPAADLGPGREIEGTIDAAGMLQEYRVAAEAGAAYRITVRSGTLADPTLVLRDERGAQIASNDDAGGDLGRGARIEWTCPASGTYVVVVAGFGAGTGTYRLLWEFAGGGAPVGGDLAVGREAQGTIGAAGATQEYRFRAEGGDDYRLSVWPGTLPDPTLRLLNDRGEEIASNDDAGGELGRGSRIEWTCPASGTYVAVVGGYGQGTGTFRVTLEGNGVVGGGATLAQGQPREDTLAAPGTAVEYSVGAEAGVTYRLTVWPGTLADPTAAILDARQNPLVSNDDAGGELGRGARIEWTCPRTATYVVRVAGFGTGTGTFRALWERADGGGPAPGPATGNGIVAGRPVDGRLEQGDSTLPTGEFVDFYVYGGRAGQRVVIAAASTDFDTYLLLRGPGGFTQDNDDASNTDRNARLEVTLPADGEYRVGVTSYRSGESGAYTLTLQ